MNVKRSVVALVIVAICAACGTNAAPSAATSAGAVTSEAPASTASATAPPRCPNPDGGANNTCLGDLTAGTYTTQTFRTELTYTVPDGWSNLEDLPGNFLLLPPGADLAGVDAGTSDYLGIYASVAAPDGCSGRADPAVARTPDGIAAWLEARSGVVATDPEPVEVGGLFGLQLDVSFDATASDVCEADDFPQPFVDVLVGVAPSEIVHSVAPSLSYRLYLLDNGDSVVAIELQEARDGGSEFGDEWFEGASPVVESLTFNQSAGSAAPATIADAFDVGDHSLYLQCSGSGSPTIVFLHGIGGDRSHGAPLITDFSDRVRVCTYDRANMGRSDDVDGMLSGADAADDLHALMASAGVPPPYLLVAGSFGGLVALVYAGEHPEDVAGMVFIDASLPSDADVDQMLAERGVIEPIAPTDPYANGGEVFAYSIHEEARAALDNIPDVPISYLRATQFEAPPGAPIDEMRAIAQRGIDDLLAHSTDGRQVDVSGPHFPFPQRPVNAEVERILVLLGA